MEYQSNQQTNKTFSTMVTLRPILDLHVVQPHLGICPIHLGIALTEGKKQVLSEEHLPSCIKSKSSPIVKMYSYFMCHRERNSAANQTMVLCFISSNIGCILILEMLKCKRDQ